MHLEVFLYTATYELSNQSFLRYLVGRGQTFRSKQTKYKSSGLTKHLGDRLFGMRGRKYYKVTVCPQRAHHDS